jgi:hypothetical protein
MKRETLLHPFIRTANPGRDGTFTHCKVLAWVAFDRFDRGRRAVRITGPVVDGARIRERTRKRKRIRAAVQDRGFAARRTRSVLIVVLYTFTFVSREGRSTGYAFRGFNSHPKRPGDEHPPDTEDTSFRRSALRPVTPEIAGFAPASPPSFQCPSSFQFSFHPTPTTLPPCQPNPSTAPAASGVRPSTRSTTSARTAVHRSLCTTSSCRRRA